MPPSNQPDQNNAQPSPQPGRLPVQPPLPTGGLPIQPGPYDGPGLGQHPHGPSFQAAHQPVNLSSPSFPHRPGSYADSKEARVQQSQGQTIQPGVYAPLSDAYTNPPYAQPQGYQQVPPTPDATPYSFFLDSQQKAKPGMVGGASSSMGKRIAIALVGLGGLLAAGAVGYSLLFNAPTTTDGLVSIAHHQQELVRVSGLGLKGVKSGRLQNFSVTTKLSVTSDQQQLLTYLSSVGAKFDPKALTAAADPKTDAALKAAESANTYDATYNSIMQSNMTAYVNKLKQAHAVSTIPKEKALLEKQHAAALLLAKQLETP